jgi:OmpA-OmpF porin, OOP family
MRIVLALAIVLGTAAADPKAKPKAVVNGDAIELSEPVYFDFGGGAIKKESYPVLDALVATLATDKKLGLVEIQGHTDERGADAYNLKVSEQRANAILKYLVGKGIDKKRLRAKGYGETKPLDPRSTEEAWAKNRRMAFVIVQRAR